MPKHAKLERNHKITGIVDNYNDIKAYLDGKTTTIRGYNERVEFKLDLEAQRDAVTGEYEATRGMDNRSLL